MATTAPTKKSIYGVHPGVLMTQKWIGELKQKTGRTLDEWLEVLRRSGFDANRTKQTEQHQRSRAGQFHRRSTE